MCTWPGRHYDPAGKLGTNLCLSALGKCLFKGWEENGTFPLSSLSPHLALLPRQRELQSHGSRVDKDSQTCPYCLITSDQSSLHVLQLWNRLNISSPTEPSMYPPVSLHPWHRSDETTPPVLLIPGCPGHKDKFYLVSKSLTISNWSKSEKNMSSQPRLKIITIAL